MPGWSRRRLLHAAAAAGTATIAGCNETTERPRSEIRERVTDFEALAVRNRDGNPVVVEHEGDATTTEDGPVRGGSLMEHLTDDSDLDDLRFRDVDGAGDLESFVTDTDLDSRSVYLLQRTVGECYVPRLVGVYREGDGVEADFCNDLRPADAACDADAKDMFAVAIRLPFAGDGFNSVGSGWSSDCDHRRTVTLDRGESA